MAVTLAGLPRPARSYLVCATPRSGSTLLCAALAATGVAGRPEEYFEARRETGAPRSASGYFEGAAIDLDELLGGELEPPAPSFSSLRGVVDYRHHLQAVLARGTGDNGVFGAKLMWMHVEDFVALARTLPELRGLGLSELLEELLAGLSFVWVRRRDTLRHAVSLWTAIQTGAWRVRGSGGPTREPRYSFAALEHLRAGLVADDAAWARWFEAGAITPLELHYERFARDLDHAVEAVLGHAGVEPPAARGLAPEPPLRRQAGERSQAWVERFRRESKQRRSALR